jgi:hypothetical protein
MVKLVLNWRRRKDLYPCRLLKPEACPEAEEPRVQNISYFLIYV